MEHQVLIGILNLFGSCILNKTSIFLFFSSFINLLDESDDEWEKDPFVQDMLGESVQCLPSK